MQFIINYKLMRPLWEPVFFYSSYLLQSSDSDNCPNVGIGPLLQFPHLLRAGPVLLTLLFSPLVSSSYQFCVVLYILFPWSGTLVLSQLVFCMHFCVWRCIPEVSMERDEFHIHLLLRHLVLLQVVVFAYVLCILIIIYIYILCMYYFWKNIVLAIDGEKVETDSFYFLGLQNDCRHWLKPQN